MWRNVKENWTWLSHYSSLRLHMRDEFVQNEQMPRQETVYAWKCCPVAWWRHARRKFDLALRPACWGRLAQTPTSKTCFLQHVQCKSAFGHFFVHVQCKWMKAPLILTHVQHKWMIAVHRLVYRWPLYWCQMMKTPPNCRPTKFRASWGGGGNLSCVTEKDAGVRQGEKIQHKYWGD